MRQLLMLSGKGGTGKTTLTAAFASLAKAPVLADCDVDAADLHLLLQPDVKERTEFRGMEMAVKDLSKCLDCGICRDYCRYDSIDENNDIIEELCEGCAVCTIVCPEGAIRMEPRVSGDAYISETRLGPMCHAKLFTAEEASGKLVAMVRKNASDLAESTGRALIIIDGPPGIGCPVIASMTGVDQVCVVTEPTVSGAHDLSRVLDVCRHFDVPACVIINRCDINAGKADEIAALCDENGVEVIGRIPYDTAATASMIAQETLIEYDDDVLAPKVREIWGRLEELAYGR